MSTAPPIELRQLRCFVAVAEELHFGRAAERLHMAQPPLSQQIRRLERELEVRLFDRNNRSVALTSAGTALFAEAKPILESVAQAVTATVRASRGELGKLGIGFGFSATYTVLPQMVSRFRKRFPEVQVDLYEMTIDQQLEAFARGDIQVGVIRPPLDNSSIATKTILVEPLVLAMPKDHPLSKAKSIRLEALADEVFVMAPHNRVGFFDSIKALCRDAGFEPKVGQYATGLHTALGLVSVGMGVAIVPKSLQRTPVRSVVYRPLADAPPAEMALAWRKADRTQITRAFVELCREPLRLD
jgi:DNA-binding transcriptional LysR family regulator